MPKIDKKTNNSFCAKLSHLCHIRYLVERRGDEGWDAVVGRDVPHGEEDLGVGEEVDGLAAVGGADAEHVRGLSTI